MTQDGETVESAPHSKQLLWVDLSERADRYDLLRVCKEAEGTGGE